MSRFSCFLYMQTHPFKYYLLYNLYPLYSQITTILKKNVLLFKKTLVNSMNYV